MAANHRRKQQVTATKETCSETPAGINENHWLTKNKIQKKQPAENRRQPVRDQYSQVKRDKNLGRETDTSEKSVQTTENDKKKPGTLAETKEKGKEHKHAPKK